MQIINDKKGLVFDLDNTIAKLNWITALTQPRLVGQLLKLKAQSDRFRGLRPHNLAIEISHNLNQSLDELDKLTAIAYRRAAIPKEVTALISAWDKMGKPRAIVSDHTAIAKLNELGLSQGWSAVISCREHNAFKPLSDGLWAAAAHLGLPPTDIVFIGDRYDTDGLAAFEFGCQFVHIDDLKN